MRSAPGVRSVTTPALVSAAAAYDATLVHSATTQNQWMSRLVGKTLIGEDLGWLLQYFT